jgi:putative ABC transport system permease protein
MNNLTEKLINNLKSTVRGLFRDKIYFSICIISLSIGILSCLFIARYVTYELSYDRFHDDYKNIHRIETTYIRNDGQVNKYANLEGRNYAFISDGIRSIPQVAEITRFATYGNLNVEANNQVFAEQEALAADSTFFDLFSFSFLSGNRNSVLSSPNSALISKEISEKYFGNSNAIGKSLLLRFEDNTVLLTVTGVIDDIPETSHFSFNIVTSKDAFEQLYDLSIYEASLGYTYLRTVNGSSINEIEEQLNSIFSQNVPEDLKAGQSFSLRPIQDIHLRSSAIGELSNNGSITYIYIFSIVGLIILSIAYFNFSTLSIAKSTRRAKEIGLRKIFGAGKQDVLSAFIIESVIITIFSILVAYVLVWSFLPYFNSITEKSIAYSDFISPYFFLFIFLIVLIAGFAIGFFPALILYKSKIDLLLKKNYLKQGKKNFLWKGMVITQFSISIIIIIAAYVFQNQINYIFTKELGFNKEQIITFQNYFDTPGTKNAFVEQLKKYPYIDEVAFSSYAPGTSKSAGTAVVNAEGVNDEITFNWIAVDDNFFDLYEIDIIEGREFSSSRASDSTQAFIINEIAKNTLGWDNPLDQKLSSFGRDGFVIGVVEDFNFLSLHRKIPPMIFVIHNDLYFTISVKLTSPQHYSDAIAFIENEWNKFHPGVAFAYDFVDDKFEALYRSEQKARTLLLIFSVLALSITFLGLFSFVSYLIEQKKREIGIRKVLGATILDILNLFYSSYFKLYLASILISVPIAYMAAKKWLNSFYYGINIGLELILLPLVGIFIIFIISISIQVFRWALLNPIDSIRTE